MVFEDLDEPCQFIFSKLDNFHHLEKYGEDLGSKVAWFKKKLFASLISTLFPGQSTRNIKPYFSGRSSCQLADVQFPPVS